jgi:hypothetical protein
MMNNGQSMGGGMMGRGHGMGWNGNFGLNNQDLGQMPGYGNGFEQMPHSGRGSWQSPGFGMLNGWWGSPMPDAMQESDDSWWPW